jgi:hypothetical protein
MSGGHKSKLSKNSPLIFASSFFFLESCRVASSGLVADVALPPAVAASEGASLALYTDSYDVPLSAETC